MFQLNQTKEFRDIATRILATDEKFLGGITLRPSGTNMAIPHFIGHT